MMRFSRFQNTLLPTQFNASLRITWTMYARSVIGAPQSQLQMINKMTHEEYLEWKAEQ